MALPRIRIGRALASPGGDRSSRRSSSCPIYLITISRVLEQDAVYEYPKNLVRSDLSTETMSFFLHSDGVPLRCSAASTSRAHDRRVPRDRHPCRLRDRALRVPRLDPFRLTIVSTRAFPLVILAIPLAVTFSAWGSTTRLGVAIAHTALALPFAVLVTASVFASISYELEEAAMTLGCSRLSAFRRVALPLALPGVAASRSSSSSLLERGLRRRAPDLQNRTLPAQMLAALDTSPLPYRSRAASSCSRPSLS